ncbi:MAG TPA: PDZ domain-containing protein [Kofleriaceae bacterium]|nr:PDZ domain-containing protein [Kofleriaceae bacterium]
MTASLMAAPASAIAKPHDRRPDDSWTETYAWSTATSRGRLGVMVIGLTPELRSHFGAPSDRGVLIGRVEPKSAAATAGLAVGDILTAVRGKAVDSAADVLSVLAKAKKDDTVSLSVIRDRKPLTLSAKMLDDPPPPMVKAPWPGWMKDWFDAFPAPWTPPHHHDTDGTTRT